MNKIWALTVRLGTILLTFALVGITMAQELPNTFETEEGYTFNYPANFAAGGGFGIYSITNNAGDTFNFTFGSGVTIEPSIEISTAEDVLAQLEILLSFVDAEVLETSEIMLGDTPAIVALTSGMIGEQYYVLYILPDGVGAWLHIVSLENDVADLLDTGIAIAASTLGETEVSVEEDVAAEGVPYVDVENTIINLPVGVSFNYPDDANLLLPTPEDEPMFEDQITLFSLGEPGVYTVEFTQNSMSDEIENINELVINNGGTLADNLVEEVITTEDDTEYTAYIMTLDTMYLVVFLREVVPDAVVVVSGQVLGDAEPEELDLVLERTTLLASTVRLRDGFAVEIDDVMTMIEPVTCNAETSFHLSEEQPAVALSCPANCVQGYVAGTDVYAEFAALCVAGIHAGVSTVEEGGAFIVRLTDGQDSYVGSSRNGIESVDAGSSNFSIIFAAIEE
ncbi:MAG: LCCL domain-containing protein [Chloroflexota bacterium]